MAVFSSVLSTVNLDPMNETRCWIKPEQCVRVPVLERPLGACVEDGLGRGKAGPPVGRLEVMKASEPAATTP